MTISEIIGICDILVTIFVGFFLAHRFSVKDTRNRSAKDYYISELTNIRRSIESMFQELLDGTISAKELVKRIEDIENALEEFDHGVRVVLPIRMVLLQYLVGNCLDDLTNIEDINNQYESNKIVLNTDSRIKIRQISRDIHKQFAEYLYQVNIAAPHGLFYEIKSTYINYYEYNKSKSKRTPRLNSILYMIYRWVCQWGIFIIVFILICVWITNQNIEEKTISNQTSQNTFEQSSDDGNINRTYIMYDGSIDSIIRFNKRPVIQPLIK